MDKCTDGQKNGWEKSGREAIEGMNKGRKEIRVEIKKGWKEGMYQGGKERRKQG